MNTFTSPRPSPPSRTGRSAWHMPAQAAATAGGSATHTRLIHLLVVDDAFATIEFVGQLLAGFAQVRFATNGVDALRLAELHHPDLVLLDIGLPGLGGFEVCRRLRAAPALRDIPIIFASSHADPDTEATALRLGADDFVRKPLSAPVLRARVGRLVDSKRAGQDRPDPDPDEGEREPMQALQRSLDEGAIGRRATASMLSYIAHEIGNPVNVIRGFAQLMQVEPLSAGQAGKLSHILDAVGRLSGLLAEVTDVARMESGQFVVELEDVDAQALAAQACAQIQTQAAAAGLRLALPAPAPAMTVRADARRLRQCLDNLLSNAMKYGGNPDSGGPGIEVEIQARGKQVVLAVQDHGCGLSEDQLAQLFEPYNRLGREGGAIPGTGLGLMLTRDLVQAMGGRVLVHSQPGHGCRFEILLRASQPPAD